MSRSQLGPTGKPPQMIAISTPTKIAPIARASLRPKVPQAPVQPGDLEASGMLFEGSDFEAWQTCILTKRRVQRSCSGVRSTMEFTEEDIIQASEYGADFANKRNERKLVQLRAQHNECAAECKAAKDKLEAHMKAVGEGPKRHAKTVWDLVMESLRDKPAKTPATPARRSRPHPPQSPDAPRLPEASGQSLNALICGDVSPLLLLRIPDATMRAAFTADAAPEPLLLALSSVARPFPFLKLSKEIRRKVYETDFRRLERYYSTLKWSMRPPPLLSVSKQVRAEARPRFFATMQFVDGHELPPDQTRVRIEKWSQHLVADCAKHLRNFVMVINISSPRGMLEVYLNFSFSLEQGLSVHAYPVSGQLTENSHELLQDHIAGIENTRKALNLQGESIIMALLTKPNPWERNLLQLHEIKKEGVD